MRPNQSWSRDEKSVELTADGLLKEKPDAGGAARLDRRSFTCPFRGCRGGGGG